MRIKRSVVAIGTCLALVSACDDSSKHYVLLTNPFLWPAFFQAEQQKQDAEEIRRENPCNTSYNAASMLAGLRKVPGYEKATLRDITTVPTTPYDFSSTIDSANYVVVCHQTIVLANGATQTGRVAISVKLHRKSS